MMMREKKATLAFSIFLFLLLVGVLFGILQLINLSFLKLINNVVLLSLLVMEIKGMKT
jgi:hypothetical protein